VRTPIAALSSEDPETRRVQPMLANVAVCATLPTTDLGRARRFYGEALGLAEGPISVRGGVFFKAGAGTVIRIYERAPGHTPAEYTVAGFLVEDLEQEMSELRRRGVRFEEYDLPHLKTENGVYTDEQRGAKGAWVRDPDGNILALTQLPNQ
jgi:catechol 2,3-dioxygenase-like lactoylglutathione lyase family enzyme